MAEEELHYDNRQTDDLQKVLCGYDRKEPLVAREIELLQAHHKRQRDVEYEQYGDATEYEVAPFFPQRVERAQTAQVS